MKYEDLEPVPEVKTIFSTSPFIYIGVDNKWYEVITGSRTLDSQGRSLLLHPEVVEIKKSPVSSIQFT